MPTPIKNFAQSPAGNLYISDGFNKVAFWDGLSADFETAGLAAPTSGALTATASGAGTITGRMYLYQRFVDRHGQPSNAVPGGSTTQPFVPVLASGSITNVTNTSPIRVTTSAAHGLSDGQVVMLYGIRGATTANGTWLIDVDSTTSFILTAAVGGTDSGLLSGQSDISQIVYTESYPDPDLIYTTGLRITPTTSAFLDQLTARTSQVRFSGTNITLSIPGLTMSLDAQAKVNVGAKTATTFLFPFIGTGTYTEGQLLGSTGVVSLVSTNTSTAGGSYTGGGTWLRGASQINYANLGSAPTQAVKRQILRTKDGDTSLLWVDVDAADEDDTTHSSTNTDDALSESYAFTELNGDDLLLNRFGEPDAAKPYMAHHGGRMLQWGFPIWDQGKVAVTNGSDTVVGQNTGWTADMQLVGRVIYVAGASVSYEIESFNATTQTLTLTENYSDTTDDSVGYAILPDGGASRRLFGWSDVQYQSAFDPTDALGVPEDGLAGEGTNLFSLDRVAWLCADNRMWRLVFSEEPAKDGQLSLGPQRGCINSRCAVTVEGSTYLMDRQGVYRLSGNSVEPVSTAIHDLFDPERPGRWKINFRWSKYFHAVHDQEHETILWFVSMTGRYPRHVLCYQYRLDRWWIEEWPIAIASSTLGNLGNRRQVFLGCEGRTIVAKGHGNLDGITPGQGTVRGTISIAGVNWFTSSGATFPSTWPDQMLSVDIVAGRGKGQRRRIIKRDSVDTTKLYVDQPWLVRPNSESVFQIAGVRWYFQSGWYNWSESDAEVNRRIDATFQPSGATSIVDLRVYANHSETPKVWDFSRSASDNENVRVIKDSDAIELIQTEADGHFWVGVPGHRETRAAGDRYVSIELRGVTNGERHRLYQLEIRGANT